MQKHHIFIVYLMACLILTACSSLKKNQGLLHLIPEPQMVKRGKGHLSLSKGYRMDVNDPKLNKLLPVVSQELYMLTGLHQKDTTHAPISIHFMLDTLLDKDQYGLRVLDHQVILKGGSYQAVAEGSVTFLQLAGQADDIPEVEIRDHPAYGYRALMIDVARSWHSIESLKQMINLCRWYKINYLQLHLTDDQSFTFPSRVFPLLPTKGRHYSWEQLVDLNQYAYQRGVTIIPELDVPSHSSSMIGAMPEHFGIKDVRRNGNTLSMGKEAVYDALGKLIGELVEVFPHSPYIHIGTDEVFMTGMEDDPDTRQYMAKHDLHTLADLFKSFIVRVADSVKAHGRQAIVWNGFEKGGQVNIPKDILVMEYLPFKYTPQDLIDDGYQVINASYKPLYNHWGNTADVYDHWNIFNWQIPRDNLPGEYKGIQIKPTQQVIGASMSNWEQAEKQELPSVRRKLPAMSERVWSKQKRQLSDFMDDLAYTDRLFGRLLTPVMLSAQGLAAPKGDQTTQFFDSTINIHLQSGLPNIQLHYTTDGHPVDLDAPIYDSMLHFDQSTKLSVQGFDANGLKVGLPINRDYRLQPVHMIIAGVPGSGNMILNTTGQVKFDDSVSITLQSKRGHTIRYATDGPLSPTQSTVYTDPIRINHTTGFIAQAYDASGLPVGQTLHKNFLKIQKQSSLTTHKPVHSSADRVDPRLAKLAVDGAVMDNDYWNDIAGGWVTVDLKKPEMISRLQVHTFWDNYRYYQYTVEISSDGDQWQKVVDFSHNTIPATSEGYVHALAPAVQARYIKITMLYNSANPIMHLVELSAFGPDGKEAAGTHAP